MFNSDAKQDQFVANIFNFKKEGSFLDIGSNNAVTANNTCFLDKSGWEGVCVEIDPQFNSSYGGRSCTYINQNALTVNWESVFKENNFDTKYLKNIDYLSLDIDQMSTSVLAKLPMDEYKFKVITIEHDYYIYGDKYKSIQKEYLKEKGYFLLCEDVGVQQSGHFFGQPWHAKHLPFEDWWIHPNFFSEELIKKINCDKLWPSQIVSKFQ